MRIAPPNQSTGAPSITTPPAALQRRRACPIWRTGSTRRSSMIIRRRRERIVRSQGRSSVQLHRRSSARRARSRPARLQRDGGSRRRPPHESPRRRAYAAAAAGGRAEPASLPALFQRELAAELASGLLGGFLGCKVPAACTLVAVCGEISAQRRRRRKGLNRWRREGTRKRGGALAKQTWLRADENKEATLAQK